MESIEDRIDRLEAIDQIRQLASKYALAADMRDLDALAGLFVDNVTVGPGITGRTALRHEFQKGLLQFETTFHLIGNHIIEMTGTDSAQGIVYCRADHEIDMRWVVAELMYHDTYARRDDRWYFAQRRMPLFFSVADRTENPAGPKKVRWPDREPSNGTMHAYAPTVPEFRAADPISRPVPEPASIDQFLERIRGGNPLPTPQYMTPPPGTA